MTPAEMKAAVVRSLNFESSHDRHNASPIRTRAHRDATAAPSAVAVLKQMRDSVDEVNAWFESVDGVAELERAYPCRPAVDTERAA